MATLFFFSRNTHPNCKPIKVQENGANKKNSLGLGPRVILLIGPLIETVLLILGRAVRVLQG